ncbi:hypothetical protein [Anaerovibrio lipolyticus]|uniref:hypothetical protein n=1 Tax=Anaerovibrio lipolyticus TaxID=82374 RepID=UPI0025D4C0A3|nr:hypothetical protein [Anaerovibrio lipolyticus]
MVKKTIILLFTFFSVLCYLIQCSPSISEAYSSRTDTYLQPIRVAVSPQNSTDINSEEALLTPHNSNNKQSKMKIGVIGAMDSEVNALKEAMTISRKETKASMEFCEDLSYAEFEKKPQ